VLEGRIPVDDEDEGLEAVDAGITTQQIHNIFQAQISDYEQRVSREFLNTE